VDRPNVAYKPARGIPSSMTRTIVVAGATGSLGSAACRVLSERGHRVRALVRRHGARVDGAHESVVADGLQPQTLQAAVRGADAVFSCMGAPIVPRLGGGRAGFESVDTVANLHLLRAAESAGVTRFAYVSVAGGRGPLADLPYVRAH
ncbi:MAG: NAD(P)H-binding protein, partial [Myxococcota bacterium]